MHLIAARFQDEPRPAGPAPGSSSQTVQIHEGTNQTQRLVIVRSLLR
ncbi:alkylation response protein AidB-like acyl-CoA dehydrogenase [Geodermatophilus bullaregiensis]|nr:hypothetical protein [Geodermatophilus bullaregiensis]MBM7805819.1 alkylation response protein AidB-like acyl-CoA dehydrogenase [Geodermatophilus bullaregiensis]